MKVFVKYKNKSGEIDKHIFDNINVVRDSSGTYTFTEFDGSPHFIEADDIVSIQVITSEEVVNLTPVVDIRVEYPQNLNEFIKDIATICIKHDLPVGVGLVVGDEHVKLKLDKNGRKTND